MSDSCSSSSFDPAPGSSLDDDLAITASTQTLSLTSADTSQRNDSDGSEAIAETTSDIPAQTDQTINSSSKEDGIEEEPPHSERACQSNGAVPAAELTEEIYNNAETARNEGSNVGAESRATVLVPGFERPSETTSVNHTAPKEEPDHGVLPTSISTAHEEGSDDNNDLTISETFLVHKETGQDADETAKEDTPQDDYAESRSAIKETIADLASSYLAQDRGRREEGSRKAKEEAIEDEVRKDFDVRLTMLQGELADLGARSATRLEERLREAQQNDTQENENEDEIVTEIEEQFRQERYGLQLDMDALNVGIMEELSRRLYDFRELRSQKESDEDDAQETSTGVYALRASDASKSNNGIQTGNGDANNGSEEVDVDPGDDLEEVEVDTEDDQAVYSNTEHDVEEEDGHGTITKEERADDGEVKMKVIKEAPIQPLDEQLMGDTVPASFYGVSSETDPADYVGGMTITIGEEDPADPIVPRQASIDATDPGILSDDNMDINKKSNDPGEDEDSNSSSPNNRNDGAEDDDSNLNAPAAHASIGPSGQQEIFIDSTEAESQEKTANKLKATDQPGEARTPAISGEVEAAGEAEATGNTAPAEGNNDSGLANNAPTSIVLTSTTPTNTNSIPANNVAAEHASQRRVRHHARKAQPKKYGVNGDNSKKGGS